MQATLIARADHELGRRVLVVTLTQRVDQPAAAVCDRTAVRQPVLTRGRLPIGAEHPVQPIDHAPLLRAEIATHGTKGFMRREFALAQTPQDREGAGNTLHILRVHHLTGDDSLSTTQLYCARTLFQMWNTASIRLSLGVCQRNATAR